MSQVFTKPSDTRPLNSVAIVGARGILGSVILDALLDPSTDYKPNIIAVLRPGTALQDDNLVKRHSQLSVAHVEYSQGGPALANALRGVDAVIVVLNAPASTERAIFEAALEAGVRRIYPTSFGFDQPYDAPGDYGARILPMWRQRQLFPHYLKTHPAVESGKIEYTYIGVGDIYDQPVWCSWAEGNDSYDVVIVGDGDALVDWSCRRDIARYVVATLAEPALSANATLNLHSETLSQNVIAELFQKYAAKRGQTVRIHRFSAEEGHRFIAHPEEAPVELLKLGQIPLDFYFVIKVNEGQGLFRRSKWECHHELFPEVKRTTFEEYLKERFGN